ncbi:MAG: hypothetical protein Q9221_004183 [Calogaya cf. arnoldii]
MPPIAGKKNFVTTGTQTRASPAPPLSQNAASKTPGAEVSMLHSSSFSPSSFSSSSAEADDDDQEDQEDEDEDEDEENDSDNNSLSSSQQDAAEAEEEALRDYNNTPNMPKIPSRRRIRKSEYHAAPRSCGKLMDDCLYLPSKGIKVPKGTSPWARVDCPTLYGSLSAKGKARDEDEDEEMEDDDNDDDDEKDMAEGVESSTQAPNNTPQNHSMGNHVRRHERKVRTSQCSRSASPRDG